MNEEAVFRAVIAAQPDDNTLRLVFADWLDEHDCAEEAELIRIRDLFVVHDVTWHDVGVVLCHGFVTELRLPVQWFLVHGAAIRARYHMLQRLAVFSLDGWSELWGKHLAACEHLYGLRELDLGCFSDAGAEALARSPHLAHLEALTYWYVNQWSDDADEQFRAGRVAGVAEAAPPPSHARPPNRVRTGERSQWPLLSRP
jgi:uncharacterized protein (TIGR02996 family)